MGNTKYNVKLFKAIRETKLKTLNKLSETCFHGWAIILKTTLRVHENKLKFKQRFHFTNSFDVFKTAFIYLKIRFVHIQLIKPYSNRIVTNKIACKNKTKNILIF